MTLNFEHEPEYDALCERLIDKTRQRKILWQETADPDVFIAAVKGVQSFEIKRGEVAPPRPEDFVAGHRINVDHFYTIVVKDQDGKQILSYTSVGSRSLVGTLFELAKRVGAKIDDRIESSLELLDTL